MQHGPDGLRTGCDRGQCSTYVPLHAIQVFIRLLSVPCLFDCVVARLNAGPSPQVARTMGSASDLGHLLNEILQVRLVKGRPAWHALSIRDEQSCDCYLVGAVARDLEALEKKMHAQQCDKNRNIKAKDIGDIATKMGCPAEKTTKIAKLMWICTEYLHDPHAYN